MPHTVKPAMLVVPIFLILVLFFVLALIFYKKYISKFTDKDDKIRQVTSHLQSNGKLNYQNFKKRCTECTNVDYYNAAKNSR